MTVVGTYNPAVFDVTDQDHARAVILTEDADRTADERWAVETPYLLGLIQGLGVTPETMVLDYGCGIGRVSKAVVDANNCPTFGVDISPSMRKLAHEYVNHPRFFVGPPAALRMLTEQFDVALAIWVLQHCGRLEQDIDSIRASLKPGGRLFVLNETKRFVPTTEHLWVDDGKDVRQLLTDAFGEPTETVTLNADALGAWTAGRVWCSVFVKK